MSWLDKIKTDISITTGDGKVYTPKYNLKAQTVEYNVAEFDFVNVKGTLVKRSMPKGYRHRLEIIFDSPLHLEEFKEFRLSAEDSRPWKINHPYYDEITVQPLGLEFDTTGLGLTVVTGDLVETISDDYPLITIDPKDYSASLIRQFLIKNAESYSFNITPSSSDLSKQTEIVNSTYEIGLEGVSSDERANEYYQIYRELLRYTSLGVSYASEVAQLSMEFLTYPANFRNRVEPRLRLLYRQYESLVFGFEELLTPNEKAQLELNAGGVIGAMVDTSIKPIEDDYINAKDIYPVIDTILEAYNNYIGMLNAMITPTTDSEDSYVPDYAAIAALTFSVNYALSNLFSIANNAKKERIIYLENDSNPILLAHRFYGSDGESHTQKFIDENDITMNELLLVEKGRKLVYYV